MVYDKCFFMENDMKRMFVTLIAFVALCSMIPAVYACFAAVPLKRLVVLNPVIIGGRIEKIEPVPDEEKTEQDLNIAYIKVEKVLKNELENIKIEKGGFVKLLMPAKHTISTDIMYKKWQGGIWILEKDKKRDMFWATYPGDLQPTEKEEEIREIIKLSHTDKYDIAMDKQIHIWKETVEQKDSANIDAFQKGGFFTFSNSSDFCKFYNKLNSGSTVEVPKVNFGVHRVIAVVGKVYPSSGYSVEIIDIKTQAQRKYIVFVCTTKPDPALDAAAVMTHPYHIVKVKIRNVKPVKAEKSRLLQPIF